MSEADLLDVANPDDDDPRPRGELIQLQCRLAREAPDDATPP